MKKLTVQVKAPSNIALIKYMGKDDTSSNLPANGSVSMTLNGLCTYAQVERFPQDALGPSFEWSGSESLWPGARVPHLSEAGIARVLRHAERVFRAVEGLFPSSGLARVSSGRFSVCAANTFPAASGIASSASSFAAVTLGIAAAAAADTEAFWRVYGQDLEFRRALARISRQGSGSSCRSFEGPWVSWERSDAAALITRMPPMTDFVLLIGEKPKSVSSSEAHSLVRTSPLWEGRVDRVMDRLRTVEAALGEGDLATVSRVTWAEMWEMHSLFHTCAEPFTYWEPGSVQALNWLAPFVRATIGDDTLAPPVVTMDAGANVHVLVPQSDAPAWRERFAQGLPGMRILEDEQGGGAQRIK